MNRKIEAKRLFCACALCAAFATQGWATDIKGKIVDNNGQPIIGATVKVEGSDKGAVTDIDGNYTILNVAPGKCNLLMSYVGYKTVKQADVNVKGEVTEVNATMEQDVHNLGGVTVVGQAKRNTVNASINQLKTSLLVESNISAQQISRTQDKDASEVIRRVPGISIIDGKFVMVRGLAQRYNNVWVNGAAVPSSEPDTRAFSFDIIPSTQLDNINIVKSPAPEYPADFSGGFILIKTKDLPARNSFNVSLGTSVNTQTHFKDFWYSKGSATDWLGFDNGFRSFNGGIKAPLQHYGSDPTKFISLTDNGFNNDWTKHKRTPIGDLKLNMDFSHRWVYDNGAAFGMLGALNYSNTYKSYLNMTNALYSTYDTDKQRYTALLDAVDNVYNNDVKWGAMLNFMLRSKTGKNYYEFKNLFNQNGSNRLTERKGIDEQSYSFYKTEYFYSSRSTLTSQVTGRHSLERGKLDWSVGYSYANRNLPDRHIYSVDDHGHGGALVLQDGNDITREFTRLDEHMGSVNLNWEQKLKLGSFEPTLKAGGYGEYRSRDYKTRQFAYLMGVGQWYPQLDVPTQLMQPGNFSQDKMTLKDISKYTDDYKGHNTVGAAYVGLNIPFTSAFSLYAGVRYEYYKLVLTSSLNEETWNPSDISYNYNDIFPSANLLYKFNDKHQVRLSYGKSVNRPEFRELAQSIFYDFDLNANVQGDPTLKPSYIHNIDFRYEFYPRRGETVSVALFYKRFQNPIEWTYIITGGNTYNYRNMNAKSADNYGVEVDVRKRLDFIGLNDFSFVFNGALIKSTVHFNAGDNQDDRPMEGQSPYLVNTGIFYEGATNGWTASILYNRIGKRITGVGRNSNNTTNDPTLRVPNSYEMPHDAIDLMVGKKFGALEVKAGVKDLLGQTIKYQQFGEIASGNQQVKQKLDVRKYKPGQTFNLSLSYSF